MLVRLRRYEGALVVGPFFWSCLISCGNDREWVTFARDVLGDGELARNPRFAKNVQRTDLRGETDALVGARMATMTADEVSDKLAKAEIGFARVSDPDILGHHPQLRRITVGTPTGPTGKVACWMSDTSSLTLGSCEFFAA